MSLNWITKYPAHFEKAPAERVRHKSSPHTKDYDDDGTVITMSLHKFMRGIADYATFLDNGTRKYISLTIEGNEAFQFTRLPESIDCATTPIKKIGLPQATLAKKCEAIFNEATKDHTEPVILNRGTQKTPYGILYPVFANFSRTLTIVI